MYVQPHHSEEELITLSRQTKDKKLYIRLETIIRAKKLYSSRKIAQELHYSSRAIVKWVHNYNEYGLDGLYDRVGTGRPSKGILS